MNEVMALIKLAPGEVGYFDDLTRIHLTISNPYAKIYKGMNITNIKSSVKSGRLLLVSGSFEPIIDEVVKQEPKKQTEPIEPVEDKKPKTKTKAKKETETKAKKEAETKAKPKTGAKVKKETEAIAKKEDNKDKKSEK